MRVRHVTTAGKVRATSIVFYSQRSVHSLGMLSQSGGPEQRALSSDIRHFGLLPTLFSNLTISPHSLTQEVRWRNPASPTTGIHATTEIQQANVHPCPSDISLLLDGFQDLSVAQDLPEADLSHLIYGFDEVTMSQPVADDELSPLLDSLQRVSCQDSSSSSAQNGDNSSTAASSICSPEEAQRVIASLQALLLQRPELATDMLMQCPDAFPSIDSVYWRQLLQQTAN